MIDDYDDRPASPDDAMREYAINVGAARRDCAWILTSYDFWVRNPYYNGPPQAHPEDYEGEQL